MKVRILRKTPLRFRLYPVDKTRVNEYGQSFDDADTTDKKLNAAEDKKTK